MEIGTLPPPASTPLSPPSGLTQAVRSVPRRAFAPWSSSDRAVSLADGAVVPSLADLLTWLAALAPGKNDRVLVVGDGSGYAAAALARVVGQVWSVECVPERVVASRKRLSSVGATHVQLRHGDGTAGWREAAPFDAILFLPASRQVRDELLEQLRVGGRLVRPDSQPGRAKRVVRKDEGFEHDHVAIAPPSDRLGDLLVVSGAARREEVEAAATAAVQSGRRIGEVLLEKAMLSESELYTALASQRGMHTGDVDALLARIHASDTDGSPLARAFLASVPRALLDHHRVAPISKSGDTVILATCDPDAGGAALERAFSWPAVELHLVSAGDYRRLWAAIDRAPAGILGVTSVDDAHAGGVDPSVGERSAPCFIALFEALLLDAIEARASVMHLEQHGGAVRVRLRVDGALEEAESHRMTPADLRGVVHLLKLSAGLDATEARLPQGGRVRRAAAGRVYDLCIHTTPALDAEHATIAIVPAKAPRALHELGLDPAMVDTLAAHLEEPSGLVLAVGPTGSGRSALLCAAAAKIAADGRRKVSAALDPIETAIEGVGQARLHPELGFGTAAALRALGHDDVDAILVGELCDADSAREAIHASRSGRLVLSSLLSSSRRRGAGALDAIEGLGALGVDRVAIADELLLVVATRLVPTLCEGCRAPVAPSSAHARAILGAGLPFDLVCQTSRGCARCAGRGTDGHTLVAEILRPSAELRDAISSGLSLDALREIAIATGLVPMRASAIALARAGTIRLEDAIAIAALDADLGEPSTGRRRAL